MNCISVNPFLLKRLFLLVFILLVLSCLSSRAEPLLISVKATPYDVQMSRIRPILLSVSSSAAQTVSIRLVNYWIGDLRSIPYGFTRVWKTPSETESGAPADCKAKAVALYQRMTEHGATRVRLVIGKQTTSSRSTHAWVEWETEGDTFVLDPTINWTAYRSRDVGPRSYVPYYAYSGNRKYRAAAQPTLLAGN